MKITYLDAYSSNPGDISWEPLEKLGELSLYDRTAPDEVVPRSRGSEIVLVNKTKLNASQLEQLPEVKYIGIMATGTNVVDLDAAHRLGKVVTNIPAYSTDSVAQSAWALLLAITNHPEYYTERNRKGEWARSEDFCYWHNPLIELAGKQMGIVGFGHIGSKVAEIAHAFGMTVATASSKPQSALPSYVGNMGLDELLRTSDVVSLHCPLTPDTQDLINRERLAMMKPTAILINTSRGPLIDEDALAEALTNGTIYAAGLDVMRQEPPAPDNPLFKVPNCMITPHIAWATKESRIRLIAVAASNIRHWLAGTPTNLV